MTEEHRPPLDPLVPEPISPETLKTISDLAPATPGNFVWNQTKLAAAWYLAEGYTFKEVSRAVQVREGTLYSWNTAPAFMTEKDRLTLLIGIASRAERLRLIKQVVRKQFKHLMSSDTGINWKNLLDWVKEANLETDGIKLDLAGMLRNAGIDPASIPELPPLTTETPPDPLEEEITAPDPARMVSISSIIKTIPDPEPTPTPPTEPHPRVIIEYITRSSAPGHPRTTPPPPVSDQPTNDQPSTEEADDQQELLPGWEEK